MRRNRARFSNSWEANTARSKGVLILFLLALSSAPAAAQDGEIAGRVTDETGAVLPGATVTLSGPDEVRVTLSDGNGNYAFPAVPAGAYSVTAALSGFSDANLQGIVVADGLVEAPLITLSIASFGDTVVVTASRTEVRVVDAPITTSVVPAATLETTASSNVGDVLRSVPGVNVIQRPETPRQPSTYLTAGDHPLPPEAGRPAPCPQ